MPNLDTSQFHEVFRDDFDGTSLNRNNWPVVYNGPGSNGAFSFSSNDLSVANGVLDISTTNTGSGWTTGGLSQGPNGTEYGLYQIHAKADAGQGVGPELILWPVSNEWPGPEVDMLESPNGDRSESYFTLHWKGDDGSNQYTSQGFAINSSQWHTYAVDWEPDHLTYYIDGQELFTTTQHVPQEPLALGASGFVAAPGDGWYNGGTDASTPQTSNLLIDWVSISEPNGSGPAATAPSSGGGTGGTSANGSGAAADAGGGTGGGGAPAAALAPDNATASTAASAADPSSAATPLTVAAAEQDGQLVLSGTKETGGGWTAKWLLDGQYQGTLRDNLGDGSYQIGEALPAAGQHTVTVYLDGSPVSASTEVTIGGAPSAAAGTSAADTATPAAAAAATSASFQSTGSASAINSQTLWSGGGTDVLVGGQGSDVMFINAADSAGWAEVQNWHAGDAAALLGVDWSTAHITWANGTDPNGQSGATATIDLTGSGHADMAVTFVGQSVAAMQSLNEAQTSYNGTPLLVLHG